MDHNIEPNSPEYYAAMWTLDERSIEVAERYCERLDQDPEIVERMREAVAAGDRDAIREIHIELTEGLISYLEANPEAAEKFRRAVQQDPEQSFQKAYWRYLATLSDPPE